MPQIKNIVQKTQTATGVTGTTYGDAFSLDGALTVAAQVYVTNPSSLSGAAAVVQVSCDASDVTPSVWNDLTASQNITASGGLYYSKVNPEGNWGRVKYSIASGSFNASTVIVVKGPN